MQIAKLYWVFILLLFVQSFSQNDTIPSTLNKSSNKYLSLDKCKTARDSINHYKAESKVSLALAKRKLNKFDSIRTDSLIALLKRDSLK